MREIVRSGPVIDGEYEVIEPSPPLVWSFWTDDFPVVIQIIVGVAFSGWLYRLLS